MPNHPVQMLAHYAESSSSEQLSLWKEALLLLTSRAVLFTSLKVGATAAAELEEGATGGSNGLAAVA